jgi:hypothetical protein
MFLHPCRDGETFRIWRLHDTQLNMLVEYLSSGTPPDDFSLPLLATDQNIYRYDPWDAMAYYRTFRDPWERRIPLERPPERDVVSVGDYPERAGFVAAIMETAETRRTTSWEQPSNWYPQPADRLWIYRHGGHMGHPLRSQHLAPTGPPRSRSPSVPDDISSHDGDSVNSWEEYYRNQALSNTRDEESGLLPGADVSSDSRVSGVPYRTEDNTIISYVDLDDGHPDDRNLGGPSICEHEPETEIAKGNTSKKVRAQTSPHI